MAHSPQADDITSLVNNVPDLTEEEKHILVLAMIKAKELDEQEQNKMSKPLEGQLYKYTNVVKGWQYRWFVLVPDLGMLEYYMLDEVKKRRPKGAVYLAGAVVSPSDEDGQSFTISAACGEIYKLKANDAKERQFWVNRIRAVAEHHTKTIAEKNPPLPPREFRSPISSFDFRNQKVFFENVDGQSTTWYSIPSNSFSNSQEKQSRPWKINSIQDAVPNTITQTASSVTEALNSVKDMLSQVEKCHNALVRSVEILPSNGTGPKCCDIDLLMLKATSLATIHSLQQCYTILQYQQVVANFPKATIEIKKSETAEFSGDGTYRCEELSDKSSFTADPSGEISDDDETVQSELIMTPEQHSLVVNIAHEMKLGADLTKVALPSFVLQPRSLLEMYADFMRHPDFFVRIPDRPSPEARMLAVLEWYLTCFHAAWEASVVKKPYNPVLGETFHCSWKVNKHNVENMHLSGHKEDAYFRVTYVAEQVSHHPPVSAFYAECSEKSMVMSGHISIKSNFLTSYAAVNFKGQVMLKLLDFKETYTFTLPSAYLRGIISVPWIELGDRVSVTCPESGYCAFITFLTKPQNGVPHRITGEIKNDKEVICRISGEWNGTLQFTLLDGTIKTLEVNQLPRHWKYIRPIAQQDMFESRKLWEHVTAALEEENYTEASVQKTKLENEQREEEQQRHNAGKVYQGKLFQKIGDVWEYKYPLPVLET